MCGCRNWVGYEHSLVLNEWFGQSFWFFGNSACKEGGGGGEGGWIIACYYLAINVGLCLRNLSWVLMYEWKKDFGEGEGNKELVEML